MWWYWHLNMSRQRLSGSYGPHFQIQNDFSQYTPLTPFYHNGRLALQVSKVSVGLHDLAIAISRIRDTRFDRSKSHDQLLYQIVRQPYRPFGLSLSNPISPS